MQDIDTLYRGSDAVALAAHVREGEVTAGDLVEAAIRAIEEMNPALNAVIHRLDDMGRAGARDVVPGSSPLAGVPFLLKELASAWKGAPLTNSSRFLKDQVAGEDSEVSRRLRAAGLLLMGKSNAPENGWSITTEPALYGATPNPWNAAVTAGGSSGGTAAAVAAGMVPVGEASDGAGSIRVPASCCGVVGLKPSRGRVTLAPFADYWAGCAYFLCNSRTARDTAAYLDVVGGALTGDPYWIAPPPEPFLSLMTKPLGRLKIGLVLTPPDGGALHPEIRDLVERTARQLEGMGHSVTEHTMPLDAGEAWKTYTDMTCVETAGLFDVMETVVGRPVTPGDVEPVTWAIIERGARHLGDRACRAHRAGAPDGPRDRAGSRSLRHHRHPDPHPAAAPPGVLRHVDDRSRRLQRPLERQRLPVPVQRLGAAGDLAAARHGAGAAGRGSARCPPWRRGAPSGPFGGAGGGDALGRPPPAGGGLNAAALMEMRA